MTAVIRLALPRLSASIMISCSISQVFTGTGADCRTKASQPRTDSSNRTKISPFAKSRAVCAVTWTSSSLATCSASSGCARPLNSMRFLRLSVQSWLTGLPSPYRGREWKASSYVAKTLVLRPGCRDVASWCLIRFVRLRSRLGGLLCGLGGCRPGALALHPAFDVALLPGRHRQCAGRHVIAHHRAGAGVGAVADGHRGHEHGVGTGPHVRTDGGTPFGRAVVIDEHTGRPDVAVLTDVRVA